MDISKLKVADLRKELKSRGLNVLGTKSELVERLQEALQDDGADNALDNDDLLDEDAVLADETDEALLEDGNGNAAAHEDDTALLTTPTAVNAPSKLATEKVSKNLDETSTPKKIILNRKAAVANSPGMVPVVTDDAEKNSKEISSNPNENEAKKIVKLGSLSAEDRAKLRTQKFGNPVSDSVKKALRAERFGMTNDALNSKEKVVDEKLLKRQARFGIVTTEDIDVKKQKRAERFGVSTPTGSAAVTSAGNDEQKRKRAQRFGPTK